MKNTLFTLIALFVAVTIMTSCDSEQVEPISEEVLLETGTDDKVNKNGRRITSSLSIMVLSANWDTNGTTCPDEELEIEVDGGVGPYNWVIQGATITRTYQGNSIIFVRTSSSESDTPLYFKATDVYGKTGSVSGTTDNTRCSFFCDLYPDSSLCNGGNTRGDEL